MLERAAALGPVRRPPQQEGVVVVNRWLVVSIALTGAALAGSLYVWNAGLLPERVPTHWDTRPASSVRFRLSQRGWSSCAPILEGCACWICSLEILSRVYVEREPGTVVLQKRLVLW